MADIPANILRQHFLSQQRQHIISSRASVSQSQVDPSAVNQTGVDVSQNIQRVMSNCLFATMNYTGSFYLPYNPKRVYLLIQNQGVAILYLAFTGLNGSFTTGMQIAAGGYYEPFVSPINSVGGSGSSGFVAEGILQ